jgi:FkbM family methyltransferase
MLAIWRLFYWWVTHTLPRRDVTIETANGRLTVDNKDWLIGKHLYVRRSYEKTEIRRALTLLRSEGYLDGVGDGTLLDAGANVDMTCIGALNEGLFARAIAFEPAPNSYRLLVQNIVQNGLRGKIQPYRLALSSANEPQELELSPDNSGDHRIRRDGRPGFFHEERRKSVTVQARTLDSVAEEDPTIAAQGANLVWVDIQGHEGHFFQGGRRFLSRAGALVVAEIWRYGILRSGISEPEFCQILAGLFTHFYELERDPARKRPIAEIKEILRAYSRPREMTLVALLRDSNDLQCQPAFSLDPKPGQ